MNGDIVRYVQRKPREVTDKKESIYILYMIVYNYIDIKRFIKGTLNYDVYTCMTFSTTHTHILSVITEGHCLQHMCTYLHSCA